MHQPCSNEIMIYWPYTSSYYTIFEVMYILSVSIRFIWIMQESAVKRFLLISRYISAHVTGTDFLSVYRYLWNRQVFLMVPYLLNELSWNLNSNLGLEPKILILNRRLVYKSACVAFFFAFLYLQEDLLPVNADTRKISFFFTWWSLSSVSHVVSFVNFFVNWPLLLSSYDQKKIVLKESC